MNTYPQEFKTKVSHYYSQSNNLSKTARKYKVAPMTVKAWAKKMETNKDAAAETTTPQPTLVPSWTGTPPTETPPPVAATHRSPIVEEIGLIRKELASLTARLERAGLI